MDILFNSDSPEFADFISENSGEGILKIQVFTANHAYPLEGVEVEVSKNINGDKVVFFAGTTDSSGIIDDIMLPTVPSKDDIESKDDIVFTNYDLVATYPKNNIKKEYEISVFDNIKIIQPIRIPITTLMEGEHNPT